jgi:hypothetical protein
MDADKKKLTAAVSAVMAYIRNDEDAGMLSAPADETAVPAGQTAPAAGMWGLSGRQQQMQWRNLMQLRALR